MLHRLFLAPVLLALVSGLAVAQEVKLYSTSEAVDPQDVARILHAPSTQTPAIKMRSLRLLDDASATSVVGASTVVAAAAVAVAAQPAAPSALALPVQFAFDSADILPTARPQLDALAAGIRLLPATQAVVIEGHTDARGADLYNEQLSQRRAYAVKRYLVAFHSIDPARLRAVGLGEYHPLAGSDALAAENRRVQFRGE